MNSFDYNSRRAREARLRTKFDRLTVSIIIILIIILLLALGVYLLIIKNSLAWLCFGADIYLIMFHLWIKLELKHIPNGKTDSLSDILSGGVMGLITPSETIRTLAPKLSRTRSGFFLALRFGIHPNLLQALADTLPTDSLDDLFEKSRSVRAETNAPQINGSVVIVALMSLSPQYESILRQLKLDHSDLIEGITWFNYLNGLVKDAKKSRNNGGIGRDLNFGYIPTLEHFGRNLTLERERAARTQIHSQTHTDIINRIIQIFSTGGSQNIALIGPNGSGRTTIINALSEELMDGDKKLPDNLAFRQIFLLDATALLSAAGNEKGRLESIVTRILNEAYAAKNIILCFDNAELFFQDGDNSINLINVLQPVLEAGTLRTIFILDERNFLELTTKNPALANLFNKISVKPTDEHGTLKVMEDQVPFYEYRHKVTYTYLSLRAAYRLSERYIHHLVMPGRALSLLKTAANFSENGLVTDRSVERAVEQSEGVKLSVSTTDQQKLLNLEDLIHQRMIDQEAAVKSVSDALRRASAGVRNEKRPIGTFLFLGPTGVGKTELAKTLASVYFDSPSDLVRFDMNEFVTDDAVSRLIADASTDSASLASAVQKNPFSVVLLDEIEKASDKVILLLLQLLDEGILRNSSGEEVSFRDTIIIATSNAGANLIRDYIGSGTDITAIKQQLINELIAQGEFKPEFINRFDDVCIFKPLGKPELLQIVSLLIDGVNETLSPQKISVTVTDEAKQILVERGYDPALGARPMRRMVQQTIENIVASAVLSGQLTAGSSLTITPEMLS